jgi:hypothetical protein
MPLTIANAIPIPNARTLTIPMVSLTDFMAHSKWMFAKQPDDDRTIALASQFGRY